jgi:hypothetical protein
MPPLYHTPQSPYNIPYYCQTLSPPHSQLQPYPLPIYSPAYAPDHDTARPDLCHQSTVLASVQPVELSYDANQCYGPWPGHWSSNDVYYNPLLVSDPHLYHTESSSLYPDALQPSEPQTNTQASLPIAEVMSVRDSQKQTARNAYQLVLSRLMQLALDQPRLCAINSLHRELQSR